MDANEALKKLLSLADEISVINVLEGKVTSAEMGFMLNVFRLDEILSTPGDGCLLPDRWDTAVKYTDNDIVEDAYLDAVAISRGE